VFDDLKRVVNGILCDCDEGHVASTALVGVEMRTPNTSPTIGL
jgi:hypothetical protein